MKTCADYKFCSDCPIVKLCHDCELEGYKTIAFYNKGIVDAVAEFTDKLSMLLADSDECSEHAAYNLGLERAIKVANQMLEVNDV